MRTLLKLFLLCGATVAVLLLAAISWFCFYSRDLPDVTRLAQFVPAATVSVSDPCLEAASVAIPYGSIGANLRNALSAVEVNQNDPGVLTATYQGFTDQNRLHRATMSLQISRTMFCASSKMLNRRLKEIRTAARLERRFTQQELFTIYANRAYFGEGLIGIQSASRYFFHKNPGDLSVAEAALLAGLVKGPSYLSPVKHSERALERRNQVIDAMVQTGSVTVSEADAAKNAPLGFVVTAASPRVQ